MTTTRAAVIKGTFLRPTVSANNRLYSKPVIAKAVARMQTTLATEEGLPLTMHTSHGAAGHDDALSQVGRVTAVGLRADGSATFEADIAATEAGRDITTLTSGTNPYVKGISIRGQWLGDMYQDEASGAMTADDLQINGIDFTGRPGVMGATIESVEIMESAMAADPSLVFESVEDVEFFEDETPDPSHALLEAARDLVESADAEEAASDRVTYADNGYKGEKRFPLDTMENTRAAWLAINAADIAESYTAPQIKRMTAKVKSAAKKFGVDIVNEQAEFEQDIRDAIEAYASTCVQNAVANINVSAYTDPDKLAAVSATLAQAAAAALAVIDFDNDDDVDATAAAVAFADETAVSSIESAGDGTVLVSNTCTHCSSGAVLPEGAMYCPTCGQPIAQAESNDSPDNDMEATMADETTEATAAAATEAAATEATAVETAAVETAPTADTSAIAAAVAEAMAAAMPALIAAITPAAVATEATAVVEPVVEATAETAPVEEAKTSFTATEVQAMVAEAATTAVAEAQAAAVADYRASSGARKGLVTGATVAPDAYESGSDDELRAFAEMDQTAFRKSAGEAILADPFFGGLNARVNARAFPG